jgi:alcohol dehydrogenase class IV
MSSLFNFSSAGHLVFGCGSVGQLGQLVARRNLRRIFIVTDQVLETAGLLARVTGSLAASNIEFTLFNGGQPEPSIEVANLAIDQAQATGCDAVLGLGGGSNMDVAKMVAAVLTHGGQVQDYLGPENVPGPLMPIICLPTTAGTGSEVTGSVILSDTEAATKVAALSVFFRPNLAVVDPELTLSCPKKVTADSGIDVLAHAIEAYTAVDWHDLPARLGEGVISPFDGNHPLGDCFAEKAIQLVGEHLSTVVHQPDNLQAREGMALAATLGGMAFATSGVALIHAMEYPVGVALHISHGEGNGLLMPYVMQYNLPTRVDRFAKVAALLGEDTSKLTVERAAQRSVELVDQLRADIGIPCKLREIGATEEMLPSFAERAFAIKRLMRMNPRDPTEAEILEVFRQAF